MPGNLEKFWVTLAQFVQIVGTFALIRVLTENIDPHTYGNLNLLISITIIANQIISGGLNNGLLRYYPISVANGESKCFFLAFKKILIINGASTLAIGATSLAILHFMFEPASADAYLLVLAYAVATSYCTAFSNIFNAARFRKIVAIGTIIEISTRIAFILASMYFSHASIFIILCGYVLACTLALFFQIRVYRETLAPVHNGLPGRKYFKSIFKYSYPFMIWGIFTAIQQVSDRWALGYYLNADAVGKYAIVFQIGYAPMIILSNLMMTYAAPIIFGEPLLSESKQGPSGNPDLLNKLSTSLIFFTFLCTGAAYFLNDFIFSILVGTEYQAMSIFLPWMVLAGGLFSIGQTCALRMMAKFKTREMLGVNIVMPLATLLFNATGANLFGIQGVVFSLVAIMSIYMGYMIYLSR